MIAAIPLFIAGVVGLAIAAGVGAYRRARARFQEAARVLGLEWQGSGLSYGAITGTLHGLEVKVDTVNRGGNNSNTVSRYRVRYPDLDLGLRIKKETGFARFAQRFRPDIEIGDEEFDRAVTVQGASGDAVRAFLTPDRQEAVMSVIAASPTAVIEDDGVEIRSNRLDTDVDLIVTRTRTLAMLASTIAGTSTRPRLQEMRRKRADHDLAGAADLARQELGADPWLDTRREAAEVLYAAGDRTGAGEEFRRLERDLPADPAVKAMAERAREQPSQREPARTDRPALPAAEVAAALFGGRLLGFQVTADFDDAMRGRRAEWTGTIRRVRSGDPGRAVVTVRIHTVDHSLFGPVEVVAVGDVAATPGLEDRVGEEATITGTLETVDPMMRAIHLADARLR